MLRRCSLIIVLVAGMSLCTGCQAIISMLPDPRAVIPPEYTLEPNKVGVLVDHLMVDLPGPDVDKHIGEQIVENLKRNVKGWTKPEIIDYSLSDALPARDEQDKLLSIQALGSRLGADVIIYANVIRFDIQGDPETPLVMPAAEARVKVIRVADGERLWPIDHAGRAVQVQGRRETEIIDEADTDVWAEKLTNMLAKEIAQLFYTHKQGD